MTATTLPALTENSLTSYIHQVSQFPMLTQEEEYMYAKRLAEHGDVEAAHALVNSHLRLVVKMAQGFRGYGLPIADLISEGNIGLMQAVKKFDAEKGFRLSTYAMWWIKASMTEYVLRSWSLVKMGTTAGQKKLFFNLRRMKHRIGSADHRDLAPDEVTKIAQELNVSERDVVEMDQRLGSSDSSLNRTISDDGENQWVDILEDDRINQEEMVGDYEDLTQKRALLASAMSSLNDRERDIIQSRQLSEEPATLETLSQKYAVSRERIRQIESKAMEKLQASVMNALPAA